MQWCPNFNTIFLNVGIYIQIDETVTYVQEISVVYKRLVW
jgi:hypothetical protein